MSTSALAILGLVPLPLVGDPARVVTLPPEVIARCAAELQTRFEPATTPSAAEPCEVTYSLTLPMVLFCHAGDAVVVLERMLPVRIARAIERWAGPEGAADAVLAAVSARFLTNAAVITCSSTVINDGERMQLELHISVP